MGDVKLKEVDQPLEENEVPKEYIIEKKFMVLDEYFKNEKCSLPFILKQIAGESEDTHKTRARMYLLACSDQNFSDIAESSYDLMMFANAMGNR